MKKFLLALLVVIKNATVIMPLMEGMISALTNMINEENKKDKKDEKISA